MSSRIRKPVKNTGAHIPVPVEINYDAKPPVFSLEKIVNSDYCFSLMDQEHKASFAEAIYRRKTLNWGDIKKSDRHSLGIEKIARTSIKAPIPRFITDDVDHFLAFRFHGLKSMVGIRSLDVFYVLWFDYNFTLYDH
jgi:hypothetical protein